MIQLRTLGQVDVLDAAGREVRSVIAQPKRLALLIYLALATPVGFRRRDTVIGLFWPELDDEHARGALRQALSFLRRALGEEIVSTRGEEEIAVNSAAVRCDVTAFAEAVATGQDANALAVYQGEFLEGFFVTDVSPELEQWVDRERAIHRRRAATCAWALAENHRAAGDAVSAAALAWRAGALAGEDEDAAARLIAFLDGIGDCSGALEVYAALADRLKQENNAEPSRETQALVQRVRLHRAGAPVIPMAAAARPPRERGPTARRLLLYFALAGVVGLIGYLAAFAGRRSPTEVNANTIAVLPLVPTTPDTMLSRVGRDLAATIAASLDGVGEIRTVDRLTVAAETAVSGRQTLDDDATLGRRHGAGRVLHGTLSREGTNVRVDVTLSATDGLASLAQVVGISAPADSLGALTDSVTWGLLRQWWRRGEPPTPSLSSVTTRSTTALRAFLDGERDISANHWSTAAAAFRSAIAADSGFWLAYFRYAECQFWRQADLEGRVLEQLRGHRQALAERDALLVDAWLALQDTASMTLRLYQEVTQRFPDYWPGWFLYGDHLFHFGPMQGTLREDAVSAFRRAVTLNPTLVPAWQHLFQLSLGHDSAETVQDFDRLTRLGFMNERPEQGGSAFPTWYRLVVALSRTAGNWQRVPRPLADSVIRIVAAMSDGEPLQEEAPLLLSQPGFPAAQIELNHRILRRGVGPVAAAAQYRGIAWAWAERGGWDSSLVAMEAAARIDPTWRSAADGYGLVVLGAWLGMLDPANASRWRALTLSERGRLSDEQVKQALLGRVAWLDGVLAFARRDRHALDAARQEARGSGSAAAGLIERSLAAFDRGLVGDRRGAARALAAYESYCTNKLDCDIEFPNIAVHRLAAAQWFLETGDTTDAMQLLTWYEAMQRGWHWVFSAAVSGLASLTRARVEDRKGLSREAREHYAEFLRRCDMPTPECRPLVSEARTALARLGGP